ncbi:DUF5007 domain-containing protein [Pedobacter frigoris]|uniref:DUF5007 domain-containing protein n=1 Tax=Pedobacter frigoris TaxID=2571272 RepID=UPI00292D4A04|nr:DUF5007 domain-containing protein [Pedobacter frigoris]
MNNKYSITSFSVFLIGLVLLSTLGCKKNLPEDRESIALDTRFTQTVYTPVLGRNTLFSDNFFLGTSSQPLTFKIINMRTRDGVEASVLTKKTPVQVWTQPYLGDEKSIAEIEAKRKIENRPLFEIREHSGQFLMWSAARSPDVKTQPDSGYVFDVEMSNSGGRRYFRDFKLMPLKERAFEPSVLNSITGLAQYVGLTPSGVNNLRGARNGQFISYNDIGVLFKKNEGAGNSLTFKFVDSLFNPINPSSFNLTNWNQLLHGFNMIKTNESVKYDVAYPIPLIAYRTKYTNTNGDKAHTVFRYDRQGFGNIREEAYISMDFAIYEPGNWEIIIWFTGQSPKFTND